jgi:hypothetical protein
MDTRLSLCRWPSLQEPYHSALHLGVEYILRNFSPIGVIAAGAILRGSPDRTSDLDLYVIHHQPFRQRLQLFFNGVPAEIFVNPPAMVERYFEQEMSERTPVTAHMLATGFVILCLDAEVERLCQKASELLAAPPPPPNDLTSLRYLTANLYEDAVDVAGRDAETATLLLQRAVIEMVNFCYTQKGLFIPRNKDLLKRLVEVDAEAAVLARQFFQAADVETRLDLAGQMADRILGARGFFEWQSRPEFLSIPWYHGSPLELTVLRAGSTITPERRLAEVFSHKPTLVSMEDDGSLEHNGSLPGFLYQVAEEVKEEDVEQHPRSSMSPGQEWLTRRDLMLKLIGQAPL